MVKTSRVTPTSHQHHTNITLRVNLAIVSGPEHEGRKQVRLNAAQSLLEELLDTTVHSLPVDLHSVADLEV